MSILQKLWDVVSTNCERIAFDSSDRTYSYQELWQGASVVAHKIKQRKFSFGPIIVFGSNDFYSLIANLGVNLVGSSYVPIDAHTPLERIELIVNACQPAGIIITLDQLDPAITELFSDYDLIYKNELDFTQSVSIDLNQAVQGDDPNYIIYTSGTTGVPKGVEVSQNNLLTFTEWMINDFKHIDQNRVLLQAPFSFDLSIFSIYPALLSGGTLVSLSKEETSNFKLLFERLNTTEINTWISTPSLVDICLLDPSFTSCNHQNLQQFIFCGEELMKTTATKILERFPDVAIFNAYGPTEATGAITSIEITPEVLERYSRLPIGLPKPGVEIKIIDQNTNQECPQGQIGEIVIVGNSVAKGYYQNPEKTKESFVTIDHRPSYRTGDAGMIDDSGVLCYQGRIDFQVKMNGYRIELQDIESHLMSMAEIDRAVVVPQVGVDHKIHNLIATIVPSTTDVDDEKNFIKGVRQTLNEKVMDYMMPQKFVLMDDFPLNQNGKIDRKAIANLLQKK